MGDYLTYADFILYEYIELFEYLLLKAIGIDFNSKYLNLKAFHENFESDKNIKVAINSVKAKEKNLKFFSVIINNNLEQ